MKRQIFWLFFSCLTAAPFLSQAMEKGDAEEPTPLGISEHKATLPADTSKEIQLDAATNETKGNAGIIAYLCDELKIIKREDLEDYLVAQTALFVRATTKPSSDWNNFFAKALSNFLEIIDSDVADQLLEKLKDQFIPDEVATYTEDIRLNIIALMMLEKAIEMAEIYAKDPKTPKDSIWKDETVRGFIAWASPHLNGWCNTATQKYLEQAKILEVLKNSEMDKLLADHKSQTLTIQKLSTSNQKLSIKRKELEEKIQESTKLLAVQSRSLLEFQARILQLETQLQEFPRSKNMERLLGFTAGTGASLALLLLSNAICPPCVSHFIPDSQLMSFLLGAIGSGATIGGIYYLKNVKSLWHLLLKLTPTAFETFSKISKALNSSSVQSATLSSTSASSTFSEIPNSEKRTIEDWRRFESSLSEEQTEVIREEYGRMFNGIFQEKPKHIKSFLHIYNDCNNSKQARAQHKTFISLMRSLTPEQQTLFKKGLEYLQSLEFEKEGENEG